MVEVEMDWLTGLFGAGKSNNASKNFSGAVAPHNNGAAHNLENPGIPANSAIAPVNGAIAPHNVPVPRNANVVGGRSRKHRKDRKDRKDRKNRSRKGRKHRKSRRSSRK